MSTDREREALNDALFDALVAVTEDQFVTRSTMRAIADAAAADLAAGWMPRPEPGRTDSVITAFRIAAETIAADEDRLRKLRVFADYWPTIDAYDPPPEVAEDVSEIVMAMVALADATRAALGTGDATDGR
ncbi:hypothetical protein [Thauera sp.]|uniref:hypothetical protein n=1 Tax=Thauera sp. TaxID=1905334 RepID=UPI002D0A8EC1|nr:hypothetical protein [Thauera sp.]HRP26372.1 hypothetical protein [Thauera sp.]